MNVALLRHRGNVVAGRMFTGASKFLHGTRLRNLANTLFGNPRNNHWPVSRNCNRLRVLSNSYSSSFIQNTSTEEVNTVEYSPRELRAKLLESKDKYDFQAWRDLLRYTVGLGKDGSYIMEEMLTKVLQTNDIRSIFSIVRILAIHQLNYEQEHGGILGSTDHRGGPCTISSALLSTTAAYVAESVHWQALKYTTQLLLMHSSFSLGRTGPVDIPDRLIYQLLGGLLSQKDGVCEVFDFLHFVLQHKREDIFRSIDFAEVEKVALAMGGSKINSRVVNDQVREAITKVMKAWLARCNNDGAISATTAKLIVAMAVQMDLDSLTTDFVRKALDGSQKQHQMMNSFLVDKPFSLHNWADNHPFSLLEGFTSCIHKHIKSKQRYDTALHKQKDYNSLYHEVNFELLRQVVTHFANMIFQSRPSSGEGLNVEEGSMKDLKHLNWSDLGEFFPVYWHLEHLARGTSFLQPSIAAHILSLPAGNPTTSSSSPKTIAQRYELTNATITDLYEQLRLFIEDVETIEAEISVTDGYSRRMLRYLCDALRLGHSPIYEAPKLHRLDDYEDEEDDTDNWRAAKRRRSQQQQKKDSSAGEIITGFRVRKCTPLPDGLDMLSTRSASKEKFGDDDQEDEDHGYDGYSFGEYENENESKAAREFVFTIPTLNQLLKEDMRGTFFGDVDNDMTGLSQTSTFYRDTYRFQARPLYWPETLQTLDRLSDRELAYMAKRIISGTHAAPSVSSMLLFADYLSEKRNIPLPLSFFSVILRMCERGKDLYGVLEVLYLAQREIWKSKHDIDFQKKLHAFRRYASREHEKRVEDDVQWDVARLSNVQWAQVMTIASKSMKFMKWNKTLYPTMLEVLALQKQLGHSELTPSSVKNLLVMFSTYIQRDSPLVLKMAEKNLGRNEQKSCYVDKVEIIALSNFVRQKMVSMSHALRLPSNRALLISMSLPLFKQTEHLRIKRTDVNKIIASFMVSTVTNSRDMMYFNKHLWPAVTRHTNLQTTSSNKDQVTDNYVQVIHLQRSSLHNQNQMKTNNDTKDDDKNIVSWEEARRDLLDFVSNQITQYHNRANKANGVNRIDYSDDDNDTDYSDLESKEMDEEDEKRDRKGRLISSKKSTNVASSTVSLKDYKKDMAVVFAQSRMALLASYLATTQSSVAEVLHETYRDPHEDINNNYFDNRKVQQGEKKTSMTVNAKATRLLLTIANHQERLLSDERLETLSEKNQEEFWEERETGYVRTFQLLDLVRRK